MMSLSIKLLLKVLGRGQKWKGGDYMSAPGGGHKVRLLQEALKVMKDEDQIILFIDRWVVFIQMVSSFLMKQLVLGWSNQNESASLYTGKQPSACLETCSDQDTQK